MGSENTPQNYLAKSGALWENDFRVYTRAEGALCQKILPMSRQVSKLIFWT